LAPYEQTARLRIRPVSHPTGVDRKSAVCRGLGHDWFHLRGNFCRGNRSDLCSIVDSWYPATHCAGFSVRAHHVRFRLVGGRYWHMCGIGRHNSQGQYSRQAIAHVLLRYCHPRNSNHLLAKAGSFHRVVDVANRDGNGTGAENGTGSIFGPNNQTCPVFCIVFCVIGIVWVIEAWSFSFAGSRVHSLCVTNCLYR